MCNVNNLRRFCSVFPSKSPIFWHTSEVSFIRKFIKNIDILIFIMKNRTVFFVFLLNHSIFEKTQLKNEHLRPFSEKVTKKWHAKKPVGWNSSCIILIEKWKTLSDVSSLQKSCIQIEMHFRLIISFYNALENFASVNGHLTTAIKDKD